MPYYQYHQGATDSMMLFEHFSQQIDLTMPIGGNSLIELNKIVDMASSIPYIILHDARTTEIYNQQFINQITIKEMLPTHGNWLFLPEGSYPNLEEYKFNDKTRSLIIKQGTYMRLYSKPMFEGYFGGNREPISVDILIALTDVSGYNLGGVLSSIRVGG